MLQYKILNRSNLLDAMFCTLKWSEMEILLSPYLFDNLDLINDQKISILW